MQVKELIKKLLEFNLNQEVKLHTSTLAGYNCIEDILDVDQPNDTECDNVYLAGDLDQCVEKTIKKNYVPRDVYEMLFDKCEKLESKLAEEVRRDTQEGKIAYLKEDMAQNYVRKDVYEMLFDKCERLEERLADVHEKLSSQERARVMRIKDLKEQLEQKKSTIDALIGENKRRIQENYELRHPRYVFSEIPNDCDGQRFIDDVKKYFNKGTYRMRVRGQHVKEEYKGTGVTAYGQNIEQSTHLRVYIEEKD
jgi:DNA repair exonuclease SbcCD ATPase subunit